MNYQEAARVDRERATKHTEELLTRARSFLAHKQIRTAGDSFKHVCDLCKKAVNAKSLIYVLPEKDAHYGCVQRLTGAKPVIEEPTVKKPKILSILEACRMMGLDYYKTRQQILAKKWEHQKHVVQVKGKPKVQDTVLKVCPPTLKPVPDMPVKLPELPDSMPVTRAELQKLLDAANKKREGTRAAIIKFARTARDFSEAANELVANLT